MKVIVDDWKRGFASSDTSQGSHTTGGPVRLASGLQETGNDHSEDLHDDEKM